MAFDDGVKTVSGSIAHTDDAATKVPFVSVKCGIEPTLTGVSEVSATQTGENLFDKATVIDNTWIVVNDTTTESAVGYRTSDYIPVKANTKYYVSLKWSNRSAYYDRNKNGIAYFSFSGGASFTCLYDGYIRITIKNDVDLDTFIVNEGNTAITYEPYNGTTYTVSLGCTIYGGTPDIVNGEGESLCGKIVFDGSESRWSAYTTGNGYAISLTGMKRGTWYTSPLALSSPLPKAPNNDNLGVRIGVNNDGIYVVQANTIDGVTDLASFKAWLSENPLTVIYPLATPTDFTFTPITPTPETVGKVNNVYCNTGDTEVTYHDNAHGFAEVTVNRCGKNFADMSKIEQGSISSVDGGNINSTTRVRTNYIKVLGGETYSFSMGGTANIYELYQYDKNKAKLTYNTINAQTTVLTTRSDCAYVRFIMRYSNNTTITPSDIVNLQIEKSASPTAYEAYSGVSQTAYLHKVIYGGTADVIKGTAKPKNLADENMRQDGNNRVILAENLYLKSGTYTISLDIETPKNFYYKPHNVGSWTNIGGYNKKVVTFTISEDNNYDFSYYISTGVSISEISNLMIEVGSSASEYVPHFEPFSFPPISMSTDEGENTLFANEGASAITYRKETD